MKSSLMGRVIRFRGGRHREVQELLPWYLTGSLDSADQERVDAHLSVCAECQAEVRFQKHLGPQIAELPLDVEQSWMRMRRRIDDDRAQRPRHVQLAWLSLAGAGGMAWRNPVPWTGGALAGALAAIGILWMQPFGEFGRYHALSAATAPSTGNIMVIFRPDTPEQQLRQTLRASHARLVGGPTDADAYVLSAPPSSQAATLAALRASADVVTAQPIDPAGDR